MCGISYTKATFKIKKSNIKKDFYKIKKLILLGDFQKIFDIVKSFRNNQIFIEILNNKSNFVLNNLNYIVNEIKKLKKKTIYLTKFEIIDDIIWVIENEILFKCQVLEKFARSNKIKLNQNNIIFFRHFLYTLESMNYLESRGRDSLGVSINFISKNNFKIKKFNLNRIHNKSFISSYQKKIRENKYFTNINFKYSNRIGYSGENTSKILEIVKNKKVFNKIKFTDLVSFEIFAHTRWASVGSVNISNTHPFIHKNDSDMNLCLMNGDIKNYNELIKNLKKRGKLLNYDKNCTSDLQPIPSLIFEKKFSLKKMLSGSYVLINFNTQKPENIYIYKKGSQGIYYTLDIDRNLHFASDVYGLVNKSDNFKKLEKNGSFEINKTFISKFKNQISHKTNLMTSDLSKKGFERFFTKEINDTEIFLKRSINKYLDFKNSNFKNLDDMFNKKVINFIKRGKVKKIIFTGMGSCYTAAIGISKYLSNKLISINRSDIKVDAITASEGSCFYLSDNMQDTILFIMAQSGTTIDTNTFALMAKKRGAYTIAIVNKKQGDITYIVDKSIYMGNGRDIEISVPSTKTYTCHLIIGFIVTEKIISILKNNIKQINFFKICKYIVSSNSVSDFFKKFDIDLKLNELRKKLFNYRNWIVVYDDSENFFSAEELRIKLSECCYKSVPCTHLKNFKKLKLKNTLVFYITSKFLKIRKFEKKNFYVTISNDKIKNRNNLINLQLDSKNFINLIIQTSLILQLLAYRVSKIIDNQSKERVKNKNFSKKIENFILDNKDLKYFKNLTKSKKISYLTDKLKRPVDSIKHQAKTITVGAIRSEDKRENFLNKKKPNIVTLKDAKKILKKNKIKYILNLKEIMKKYNNIKFLGSGVNYTIAKRYAHYFSKIYNRTIACDIIENHKHIDISSEPLILILSSNIYRQGFQSDICSELEKFIAHNNVPIVFTNIGDNSFEKIFNYENINYNKIIKLPCVKEKNSESVFKFYFQNFIR